MKKKKIILSYDYELFFGIKSGTVQKSLIAPTNMLLDCMDSLGAKGNFFVDYLMFERLEQLSDERALSDLKLLKDQVRDMVRRGHRIELHLHPHWIDAKYNGDGTWDYSNYTHYSLYSLTDEERRRMFKDGTSYLNNLAREIDPNYNICAFRAGGWTIQPFDLLKDCFIENGIVIDSSVMFGACQDNKFSRFDFRKAPNKEIYKFANDVCEEDDSGAFLEVPITMYRKPFVFKIVDKILGLFSKMDECITDGTHERYDLPANTEKQTIFKTRRGPYSLVCLRDSILHMVLLLDKRKLITTISHPKDFKMSCLSLLKIYMKDSMTVNYIDFINKKIF